MVEVLLKFPEDLRRILKSEQDVRFLESVFNSKAMRDKNRRYISGEERVKRRGR